MSKQPEYKPTAAFPEPNYTQTPNDFFGMVSDMSDAELRVTIVMIRETFGFHRDSFKMGVSKLADAAGLSRQGTLDGTAAAEKRGTFRRINPDTNKEAEWELVIDLQTVDPSSQLGADLQPVEGNPQAGRGLSGVKEKKESSKGKVIIINPITAQLFMDTFGQFNSQKEQERWGILYDSIGPDRAREIIVWAEKKEIHLANRPSLLDSLETAAKKWKTGEQRKQTAAQSEDRNKYISNEYADLIEH